MTLVLALAEASCGGPRASVASRWQPDLDPCRPAKLLVEVTAKPPVSIQAGSKRADVAAGQGIPVLELTGDEVRGPSLEIVVGSGERHTVVAHPVSPPPVEIGLDHRRLVDLAGQLPARAGEARREGDVIVWSFPACNVARAQSEGSRIEIGEASIAWRLPVSGLLEQTLPNRRAQDARFDLPPLALRGRDGSEARLTASVAAPLVLNALFGSLPNLPQPRAPQYRRGAPMVVLPSGRLLNAPAGALPLSGIAAVAVISRAHETVETCQYERPDGAYGMTERTSRNRSRDVAEVSVFEARSGRLLGHERFYGGEPPLCPRRLYVGSGRPSDDVFSGPDLPLVGSPPDVEGWLRRF